MMRVTIDGITTEVAAGTTILKAAQEIGIKIPTLCYHPDQDIKANCRICVVEVEASAYCSPPAPSLAATAWWYIPILPVRERPATTSWS